jgi:biotin operon repressor
MNGLGAIVTVACAAIMGVAAFILTLFQIRHLKLSIRQLKLSTKKLANELEESRQALYKPNLKEIEEYGRRIAEEHRHRLKQMAHDHSDYLHSLDDLSNKLVKRTYQVTNVRARMQENLIVVMREQIEAMEKLHHLFVSMSEKINLVESRLESKK